MEYLPPTEPQPEPPKHGAAPQRHRRAPRRDRGVCCSSSSFSCSSARSCSRFSWTFLLSLWIYVVIFGWKLGSRHDAALARARARTLLRVSRLRSAGAPARFRSAARRVHRRGAARGPRARRLHRAGRAARRLGLAAACYAIGDIDARPLLVRVRRSLRVLESLQHDSDAAVRRRTNHRCAVAAALVCRLRCSSSPSRYSCTFRCSSSRSSALLGLPPWLARGEVRSIRAPRT